MMFIGALAYPREARWRLEFGLQNPRIQVMREMKDFVRFERKIPNRSGNQPGNRGR